MKHRFSLDRPTPAPTEKIPQIPADIAEHVAHSTGDMPFLSRRAFVAAGATAAMLAPGVARAMAFEPTTEDSPWDERPPMNAEQRKIYNEGMEDFWESARTLKTERKSVFIQFPDGRAEWRIIPQVQQQQAVGNVNDIAMRPDHDLWMSALREAKRGAFVEDIHTHPIHMLDLDAAKPIDNYPLANRVPPSPADLIGAVTRLERDGFDERAASRVRNKVLTAAGIWEYGPRSYEVMQIFLRAMNASIPVLERLKSDATGARAAADYIRGKMQNGEKVAAMFQNPAGLSTEYTNNQVIISILFPLVLAYLADPQLPASARRYFEVVRDAEIAQLHVLRTIDPSSDGLLGNFPSFDDGFVPYLNRWRGLKFGMDFTLASEIFEVGGGNF